MRPLSFMGTESELVHDVSSNVVHETASLSMQMSLRRIKGNLAHPLDDFLQIQRLDPINGSRKVL